jgi:hypothetical protein
MSWPLACRMPRPPRMVPRSRFSRLIRRTRTNTRRVRNIPRRLASLGAMDSAAGGAHQSVKTTVPRKFARTGQTRPRTGSDRPQTPFSTETKQPEKIIRWASDVIRSRTRMGMRSRLSSSSVTKSRRILRNPSEARFTAIERTSPARRERNSDTTRSLMNPLQCVAEQVRFPADPILLPDSLW